MKIININLPDNSYSVSVGNGLLLTVTKKLKETGCASGRAIVVTNSIVGPMYRGIVRSGLEEGGFAVDIIEIPDGESTKTLTTTAHIYDEFNRLYADRRTPVLALGGGVIGDMAGFAAATYARGLPLFQIPTTLLAQVDSSIGGKVGVDHGQLKNMVGAFYQPRAVLADTDVLKTLPARETRNGMAEIIKYAFIKDAGLFAYIENNLSGIKGCDQPVMEHVIATCAGIKARLVEVDEKDTGPRHLLNFGHTIGHGVESASNFRYSHGEAVAVGMVAAAKISVKLGHLDETDLTRLKTLLIRAGLPTQAGELDRTAILQALSHDKKIDAGKLKYILARSIGEAFISTDVNVNLIEEALAV